MSCNITAGISTGCNDQVGGIVGIHYFQWYPDLVVEKDANGVIIRIYRASLPDANILWYFIQADNSMGSVTETYNVGGTGSILGFHQSASFFIPETATPSANDPTQNLNEFVEMLAAQNNLVIGIETQDNGPMESYSRKCFVFGLERPAYCASGSKESGISYTDNNGYNLELAADSKAPMQEIAYMAMHSNNLIERLYVPNGDTVWTTNTIWNLDDVAKYEGANITLYDPPGLPLLRRSLIAQPGETVSYEILVTVDWSADAFSGTTFLPELSQNPSSLGVYTLDTTAYPLPTAPGVATLKGKSTFTNNTNAPIQSEPVVLRGATPSGINMNTPPFVPYLQFLTITRST